MDLTALNGRRSESDHALHWHGRVRDRSDDPEEPVRDYAGPSGNVF